MENAYSTNMRSIGLYRSSIGYEKAEQQIANIEETALKNKFDLLKVKDLANSQLSKDQLISEIIDARVDYLIVWRLDCLAPLFNSLEEMLSFMSELSRKNIMFLSIRDGVDTDTEAYKLLITLDAAWVELKSNRRIENARRSSIKTKLNGNKPGPNKKRDDQKIFKLRQQGYSIRKIAKELDVSPALVHQVLKKVSQKTITPPKGLQT